MSTTDNELFSVIGGFVLLIAFDLSFSHQGWQLFEKNNQSTNQPKYKNFWDFWLSIHMLPRLK